MKKRKTTNIQENKERRKLSRNEDEI